MKEINTNKIEQALAMYTETVSPSQDMLVNILNQIPEKENAYEGRVIRSPYIWLAFKKYAPVFVIALVLIPVFDSYNSSSFYNIDESVEAFQINLDNLDYEASLNDYN